MSSCFSTLHSRLSTRLPSLPKSMEYFGFRCHFTRLSPSLCHALPRHAACLWAVGLPNWAGGAIIVIMPSVSLKFILHMCNMYRCDLTASELAKYPNWFVATLHFESQVHLALLEAETWNFKLMQSRWKRLRRFFYFVLVLEMSSLNCCWH